MQIILRVTCWWRVVVFNRLNREKNIAEWPTLLLETLQVSNTFDFFNLTQSRFNIACLRMQISFQDTNSDKVDVKLMTVGRIPNVSFLVSCVIFFKISTPVLSGKIVLGLIWHYEIFIEKGIFNPNECLSHI